MKVTVWKSEKESNERAITRFNKKVQGSRKLLVVRAKRYHARPESKRHARKRAIMRDNFRAAREKSKFY